MATSLRRVLLLAGDLTFRGSTLLLLRMVQGLLSRQISAEIICTQLSPLDQELTQGLKIREVRGYLMPVWGRFVRHTIWYELKADPPDVIHAHGPEMLQQAVWLGRHLDRPVILTITDHTQAAQIVIQPALQRQLHCIVCVSDSVRQALPASVQSVEQRVIYPGVPLDLTEIMAPVLPNDRLPVLGMAGSLETMKGCSFFLRACKLLREMEHRFRIVVAGTGSEDHRLRDFARSLDLMDDITFVDSRTSVSVWMSALDIFCLPSLQQGFGMMLLEAMAKGRPVVASNVGGIVSYLNDEMNGMLVRPSDSRALADKLSTLLGNVEMARKIAIAGQNTVEDRFTLDHMTDAFMDMYQDLSRPMPPSHATLPLPSVSEVT